MTRKTSPKVARQARDAVQAALAEKFKELEIEDGAALYISPEAEADIQKTTQETLDARWPGAFKVTTSFTGGQFNIEMREC